MPRLIDLFEVTYPSTLVFGHQKQKENGTPFVTSRGRDNGVAGYVAPIPGATIYSAGSITVPLKGTVLMAFLQPNDFYCAHQIAVLTPRVDMSDEQKLFYVLAIRSNRYRFNYGRQADRTLREMELPSLKDIPAWVSATSSHNFDSWPKPAVSGGSLPLDTTSWRFFVLGATFDIKRGARITKSQQRPGDLPFIGAIDRNNGVSARIEAKPLHPAGGVTVNYNGSVGEAFYQPNDFWCSDDVNAIYQKGGKPFSPAVGLFLAAVIRKERYRFNYGRKWHTERMASSKLKLPAIQDASGNWIPDWAYMARYIERLPYSSQVMV